jgi:hypothetical protein
MRNATLESRNKLLKFAEEEIELSVRLTKKKNEAE